jgi:LuxR family maltose regulon positive regulatory protein
MIGTRSNYEFQVAGLMQNARLLMARGEHQTALQVLDESWTLEPMADIPIRTRARLAALMVEIALAVGDLEIAERYAERVTIDQDAHPFYRFINLTNIRMLLAQNKDAEAYALLEAACQTAESSGWQYGEAVLCLMRSLAASEHGSALEHLNEALTLAYPAKLIRSFVDLGTALVPLLKEAAHQGIHPEYVGEILAVYEKDTLESLPPGIEPLSDRELEVLRLLAAGMTNRQIAEQLVVSISTVKSHVHHISGKLDANNRTQAVSRARKLGIL